MSNTISIHRILKAPVDRVFRAFSDPQAKATWLPPFGFICTVHSFDFKEGGHYSMSFTNFTNEHKHSWGGTFKTIKPNELLVISDKFDDPNLSGEMTVTVSFKEVLCGTEINIKQEGIPEMIPSEMCYLGWQESLIKLTQLVEPEINQ
jgi:uncharacterized protein YndB with AHSA1/START domain